MGVQDPNPAPFKLTINKGALAPFSVFKGELLCLRQDIVKILGVVIFLLSFVLDKSTVVKDVNGKFKGQKTIKRKKESNHYVLL